ncbi:cation-efflux pump [Thermostilla marina]
MTSSHVGDAAHREKKAVAALSLAAAVVLTTTKLVVGLATNSLGILSEALHSGLDLAATGMTLWAVYVAARPADSDHTYGHGKIENLSALGQTLLLLATCSWVLYEACARLFWKESVHVEASFWAFAVIIISIAVDVWRARALKAAADKFQSQALEADALHFSSDIWSSLVVLLGLVGVWLAGRYNLPVAAHADAAAAVVVAILVLWVSLRLAKSAIDELLDRTTEETVTRVREAAASVEGVEDVHDIRVRRSGASLFGDVTVTVGRHRSFEHAHRVADEVAEAVRDEFDGADIVVHVEPVKTPEEPPIRTIQVLAARHELSVHDIRFLQDGRETVLELHLEVPPSLTLAEAHAAVTRLENEVCRRLRDIDRIVSHIEPWSDRFAAGVTAEMPQSLKRVFAEFTAEYGKGLSVHDVQLRYASCGLSLSFHCELPGDTNIIDAHDMTRRFERRLRAAAPDLARVVIHVEPAGAHRNGEPSDDDPPSRAQDAASGD